MVRKVWMVWEVPGSPRFNQAHWWEDSRNHSNWLLLFRCHVGAPDEPLSELQQFPFPLATNDVIKSEPSDWSSNM